MVEGLIENQNRISEEEKMMKSGNSSLARAALAVALFALATQAQAVTEIQ